MVGFTPLAQRPTPTHLLSRLSDRLGAEVWVKRDDLTGFGLSGNKVRKLEFILADAVSNGVDTVITTGGLQSNHCRATVVACRQLGLEPVLLLRGCAQVVPDGNLLLDHLLGARIHYCSAETYRTRRDEVMDELAVDLREQGRHPLVIPEGGSNGLGALAFLEASREVREQLLQPLDATVVAVGSGGTLAGLALGEGLGVIQGIAVCDNRSYFVNRVTNIASDALRLGGPTLPLVGSGWEVVEGYQGPAYGVATPSIWRTIAWVARHEGVILDPVYTGKAMHGLISEVEAGRLGGRLLFWHTGGGFGLFGRGSEVLESCESTDSHIEP